MICGSCYRVDRNLDLCLPEFILHITEYSLGPERARLKGVPRVVRGTSDCGCWLNQYCRLLVIGSRWSIWSCFRPSRRRDDGLIRGNAFEGYVNHTQGRKVCQFVRMMPDSPGIAPDPSPLEYLINLECTVALEKCQFIKWSHPFAQARQRFRCSHQHRYCILRWTWISPKDCWAMEEQRQQVNMWQSNPNLTIGEVDHTTDVWCMGCFS